jgi:2'-5' RNA ligase
MRISRIEVSDVRPDIRTIGIAIPIPEPHGTELQDWRSSFGDPQARAIPTHVTLLPPTVIATSALRDIEEHLAKIAVGERPFPMRLRSTGTFRPVSPVVFVRITEGVADCARLERRVRSGPLAREVRFEYHPHVTVAHDVPEYALDIAYERLESYDVAFPVAGFSLYEHGQDGVWRPRIEFAFVG